MEDNYTYGKSGVSDSKRRSVEWMTSVISVQVDVTIISKHYAVEI